jgi:hypothetical protein
VSALCCGVARHRVFNNYRRAAVNLDWTFAVRREPMCLQNRVTWNKINISASCCIVNPLTLELKSSAQRCLTRFFTGDFASWTVHFVNIFVNSQQMQQLFIQFFNFVCSSYMFRHYIAIFREHS